MALTQSLFHLTNTIPFTKSPNTPLLYGHSCYHRHHHAKNPILQVRKPGFNGGVVKAMKADRRDNYDQLSRPAGLKRREPSAAPIGLWDRFPAARTVQQMLDTMDRMIEEPVAFNSGWPSTVPNNGGGYVRGRTPWEIKEADTGYKMRFDMPGMTKDDVKVWVEEKMLVIKAEKVAKEKDGEHNGGMESEEDWPAKSYGKYNTQIALPENVEFEKIKAEVKDGVLYVTIPKASRTSKIHSINVE